MKDPLFYKIIQPFIITWMRLRFRPRIINSNNIPKKGRVLIAGTHVNNADGFLLAITVRRCIRFLAKAEVFKGITAPFAKGIGMIPVNRQVQDKSVIPTVVSLLEQECAIGIFPEGTINRERKDLILPFKPGVIKMAIEGESPIVPFAIISKYPKYSKRVQIIFGEAYYPKTKDITKELAVLEKKVKAIINGASE